MHKQVFTIEKDGFNGVWYPNPEKSRKGMILMLGDSAEDRMAVCGAKWLHENGCHVMAMSPDKKDYGHHNYPLERFARAIAFMKENGCKKLGIAGASTTGMLALIAAAYYPELKLTIAMSPCDFVMEGFYRDGLDGMEERPGNGESSVSWQGKPLPYLPYAYRHPDYWKKIQEESKRRGDRIASRDMFDESERLHPLTGAEMIPVEKIKGKIILIGAEDDSLWDTCRYIRRMSDRLEELPHECVYEMWTYQHGTHFVFPQSLLKKILPIGGNLLVKMMFRAAKEHPDACKRTRNDIDSNLENIIAGW